MTFHARTRTALVVLAAAGPFALPAAAQEVVFMAELSGAAQVPPVETEATGMADVTVDGEAMTVSWLVTYEGLSGEPVAAHFHGPATPEETAPPVIDITESLLEGADEDRMEGSAEVTADQMADLQAGLYYINIHTPENPDGEIRGQVIEGEAEMEAASQ
jgi:hypothetical protein